MVFFLTSAGKLIRKTSFPIRVSRLYSCDWHLFPVTKENYIHGQYSVVLRYDSDSKLCRDIINGHVMGIPYPNVVFKFPGMKIRITEDSPRSTIGFSYPAEVIKLLHSWGMFPKEPFLPLTASPELKRLIGEFIKFSRTYPTLTINPGIFYRTVVDAIRFSGSDACISGNGIYIIRTRT